MLSSRRLAATLLALLPALVLSSCGSSEIAESTATTKVSEEEITAHEDGTSGSSEDTSVPISEETVALESDPEEYSEMIMLIDETPVEVIWEDNESVEALEALVSEAPVTIEMSVYGGFEQVGSLGQSLPREDISITTGAGDIVLYSGDQIVIFYGSNSWEYTRLGHISDKSEEELTELLGNGDVTITITTHSR